MDNSAIHYKGAYILHNAGVMGKINWSREKIRKGGKKKIKQKRLN